jgi:hypothetical protein
VGGIISLWWAASFRYGGRHHLVMMGGLDRNQHCGVRYRADICARGFYISLIISFLHRREFLKK